MIINADDLGYTGGVNAGIIDGFQNGIIRSSTCLLGADHVEEAARLAWENPGLGVGVHLNLTLGRSLTGGKTITDGNGYFYPGRTAVWSHDVDYHEVYLEWKAQIDRYIEVFHHRPTHLDSHHSVHDATEEAERISRDLALEYGLVRRRYSPYRFVAEFFGQNASPETLIGIFEKYSGQDIELMVHPAYCDRELYEISSYSTGRVVELSALCSEKVKAYVREHGIELVHY